MGLFTKLYLFVREVMARKEAPIVGVGTMTMRRDKRPYESNYIHARSLLVELTEVVLNSQSSFTEPEILQLQERARIILVHLGKDTPQKTLPL
jgi:hypothetical protein